MVMLVISCKPPDIQEHIHKVGFWEADYYNIIGFVLPLTTK